MKTVLQAVAQYWKKLDKPLLFAAMLCSALSVVLLYSIYVNHTLSEIDDDDYIIQLVAVGIGVLSVLVLAAIDYHKIARLWFVYAPIALILVLLTFTSLGYRRAGADDQAWLQLGSVTLQPSEILKLAFILTFSLHLAKDEENMNRPLHMLLLILHGCMPIGRLWYGSCICFYLCSNDADCSHLMEICACWYDCRSGGFGGGMEFRAGQPAQKPNFSPAASGHRSRRTGISTRFGTFCSGIRKTIRCRAV